MKKTEILDVVSRKLAPFMFLFGFYLLAYGHLSPGGGFQGGVVISSGIILLALSRGAQSVEILFPIRRLSMTEAATYLLLLASGVAGMVLGVGFLGNLFGVGDAVEVPRVGFILLLNVLIGLKVGAGVSLICLHLFRED
jgi:multicomponent Na+:H+ antiporter subunit B